MFKVGKKVVCVYGGGWVDEDNEDDTYGPHRHEVTTVEDIVEDDGLYLQFKEYPAKDKFGLPIIFAATCFRPIDELPNFLHLCEERYGQEAIYILHPEVVEYEGA